MITREQLANARRAVDLITSTPNVDEDTWQDDYGFAWANSPATIDVNLWVDEDTREDRVAVYPMGTLPDGTPQTDTSSPIWAGTLSEFYAECDKHLG